MEEKIIASSSNIEAPAADEPTQHGTLTEHSEAAKKFKICYYCGRNLVGLDACPICGNVYSFIYN